MEVLYISIAAVLIALIYAIQSYKSNKLEADNKKDLHRAEERSEYWQGRYSAIAEVISIILKEPRISNFDTEDMLKYLKEKTK